MLKTTRPRYSRLTWWTIPAPGGTIVSPLKALAPLEVRPRPPFQELETLFISLEFKVQILLQRVSITEVINLYRVVNDKVHRYQRIHKIRIATQPLNCWSDCSNQHLA